MAKRVTKWCESGIGHTAPSGTGSIAQWPPSAEAGAFAALQLSEKRKATDAELTEVPFQCSPCH